jgi:hypothetical protein
MALRDTITKDILSIEADLENPTFAWDGETYLCVPSSTEAVNTLDKGGFSVDRILNLTVRKLNDDGSPVFADGIYPKSKEKVTFNDVTYRILTVKHDPTGAILHLMCYSALKGI